MSVRPLKYQIAAAVALALLASSPASAQLDQRLAEAEQKLDSDVEGCRPINMGDYTTLLREAAENKQRADKAARRGVPIDQAKVDGDLARAQSLFNRANAALVQQCIRQATQPQTAPQPQTTDAVPGAASSPAQGLTDADQQAIASQQWTVEGFESALEELRTLMQQGKCEEVWDLVDELDEWLDELDGSQPMVRPAAVPAPRIPARLIDEWDRRIDDILDSCPRPGRPKLNISAILQLHNLERAKFGYEPLRWSLRLADNAQTYADQLARTNQLVHASREGRGTERENISQGLPGWSVNQLMGSWLDERRYFTPGIFPNVSTTGDWYQIGHYSQMIWPTTLDIGCGMAVGNSSWLVCRYDPGGNKDGKPVGQIHSQQIAQGPASNETSGRRASLFDLGIYGGGAWTADWFSDSSQAMADQIILDHDYGYDGALFVGYDLGAFRLEAEAPYGNGRANAVASQLTAQGDLVFVPAQPYGRSCVVPGLGDYDLVLSTRVGDHYSFRLGVNNLLDRDPPPMNSAGGPGSSSGSWTQVYDAMGRYIFAGCTLDF